MSSDFSEGEPSTRYEGYADYRSVSRELARAVENAVDAYAKIQSRHSEGARVSPEVAAEASAHILGAALKLLPELKGERSNVDEYQEIVDQWEGANGSIERLKNHRLSRSCPEWLGDFVIELRKAGFELGYLKAGRDSDDTETEWYDGDMSAMIE